MTFIRIYIGLLAVGCSAVVAQDAPPKPAQTDTEPITIWNEVKALVPTQVILPPQYDPASAHTMIVALHGYGGSAEAFSRVGRKLASAGFIVAIPEASYTILVNNQKLGYDWFLYHTGDEALQLRAGMLAATDHIPRVVTDLRRRYRLDAVYLLGFSQGAMMAFVTGINHNGLFDGIVTFGLPAFDTAWFLDDTLSTARDLRILVIHGEQDEPAPIAISERARDELRSASYDVTYRAFAGGHSVPNDELDFVKTWVQQEGENEE